MIYVENFEKLIFTHFYLTTMVSTVIKMWFLSSLDHFLSDPLDTLSKVVYFFEKIHLVFKTKVMGRSSPLNESYLFSQDVERLCHSQTKECLVLRHLFQCNGNIKLTWKSKCWLLKGHHVYYIAFILTRLQLSYILQEDQHKGIKMPSSFSFH